MDINQLTDFEGLHIHHDKKTGLFAIVAVHNTKLGPAIGGCRCVPYDTIEHAVSDAMLLARAMSRKSAISGLPNGGAKGVIMRPPVIHDEKAFFESYGEFIESLGGVYYTAVDSGTTQKDLDIIATKTKYITAQVDKDAPPEATASYLTAQSVWSSMRAAAKFTLGNDGLSGLKIAVQGAGKVGAFLIDELVKEGAEVVISETNHDNLEAVLKKHPNLTVIAPADIITTECDILAPCALGGVINEHTVHEVETKIICGAANNQLSHPEIGEILLQRGITYVPDFVANAGGVILASMKLNGFAEKEWHRKAMGMADMTLKILQRAQTENRSTEEIACQIADERLNG